MQEEHIVPGQDEEDVVLEMESSYYLYAAL